MKNALKIALSQRLAEINASSKAIFLQAADDPEEVVRDLMVKYFPRFATLGDDKSCQKKIYQMLISIAESAAADIRHLDVLNNFYEKIITRPNWQDVELWQNFLNAYAYSLECFINGECHTQNWPTNKDTNLFDVHITDVKLNNPQTIKVLILADNLFVAKRIESEFRNIAHVNLKVLICNNRSIKTKFFLGQVINFLRSKKKFESLKNFVVQKNIFFTKPLHHPKVVAWLRKQNFSIGLHAMGVIYRQEVIDSFKLGILNSHIGILPEFRGRSVLEWSLLLGFPPGITVFFIDSGIDTGSKIIFRYPLDYSSFVGVDAIKKHAFALDGKMFKEAVNKLSLPNFVPQTNEIAKGKRYYVMSKTLVEIVQQQLHLAQSPSAFQAVG